MLSGVHQSEMYIGPLFLPIFYLANKRRNFHKIGTSSGDNSYFHGRFFRVTNVKESVWKIAFGVGKAWDLKSTHFENKKVGKTNALPTFF